MTHRPTTAVIKGSGFNSQGGGFTRIIINGTVYHPDDVAAAVQMLPKVRAALAQTSEALMEARHLVATYTAHHHWLPSCDAQLDANRELIAATADQVSA